MNIYLGYDSKVWKGNDQPIMGLAWECTLAILGKRKDDSDAPGCSVTIYFGESSWQRKDYLALLKAEVEKLIEANDKAMKDEEERFRRKQAFEKEVEQLEQAQQKELEAMEAVKELKNKHEAEAQAVKEQLRKKYGIE